MATGVATGRIGGGSVSNYDWILYFPFALFFLNLDCNKAINQIMIVNPANFQKYFARMSTVVVIIHLAISKPNSLVIYVFSGFYISVLWMLEARKKLRGFVLVLAAIGNFLLLAPRAMLSINESVYVIQRGDYDLLLILLLAHGLLDVMLLIAVITFGIYFIAASRRFERS